MSHRYDPKRTTNDDGSTRTREDVMRERAESTADNGGLSPNLSDRESPSSDKRRVIAIAVHQKTPEQLVEERWKWHEGAGAWIPPDQKDNSEAWATLDQYGPR